MVAGPNKIRFIFTPLKYFSAIKECKIHSESLIYPALGDIVRICNPLYGRKINSVFIQDHLEITSSTRGDLEMILSSKWLQELCSNQVQKCWEVSVKEASDQSILILISRAILRSSTYLASPTATITLGSSATLRNMLIRAPT